MKEKRKVASTTTHPDTDAKLANIIHFDKFSDHEQER